jgi:hypothetical protein
MTFLQRYAYSIRLARHCVHTCVHCQFLFSCLGVCAREKDEPYVCRGCRGK